MFPSSSSFNQANVTGGISPTDPTMMSSGNSVISDSMFLNAANFDDDLKALLYSNERQNPTTAYFPNQATAAVYQNNNNNNKRGNSPAISFEQPEALFGRHHEIQQAGIWSQFILPDPTYDGGSYPASPEDYSANAVDQLSAVNQLSGSPEELSINAVTQLAMAGLVDSHQQQQFQSGQLHHLQPPATPGLSLIIPKQEYLGEQQQLNYAQQHVFDSTAEPGSQWSQEVKLEQQTSIQYQPTSVGQQKNFSQERQVELREGPSISFQYVDRHQRQEYPYVGGVGQYGDTVQYKEAMYSNMTGQQQQEQYRMDSQQQLIAGFTEVSPYHQVPNLLNLNSHLEKKTGLMPHLN